MTRAFSVFTPVYNRAHCLADVYRSLFNQDFVDFEWIIVNDGSSDNTRDLVLQFINEGLLSIKYIEQHNSGKHVAQNQALLVADSELFLPLAPDDTIVSNALSFLWDVWEHLDDKKRYSGIGVLCMNGDGQVIGDLWPKDHMDSNDLEMTFKYHVRGEKWGPIRTDIMRDYLNDPVPGHFLSESTVWFRIAEKYEKRYINKALRIYELSPDSISRKSSYIMDENAESKLHSNLIYIYEFWRWYFRYDHRSGIALCLSSLKATASLERPIVFGDNSLASKVKPLLPKLFIIAAAPCALLYCWIRKVVEIRSLKA